MNQAAHKNTLSPEKTSEIAH